MIVVFLAAYGIPVTFGSVMSVLGSNQLANLVSFTPGGIGVNQAFNSFALESYTSTQTATAYSTGQQLITTAFNMGFAIISSATSSAGRADRCSSARPTRTRRSRRRR